MKIEIEHKPVMGHWEARYVDAPDWLADLKGAGVSSRAALDSLERNGFARIYHMANPLPSSSGEEKPEAPPKPKRRRK